VLAHLSFPPFEAVVASSAHGLAEMWSAQVPCFSCALLHASYRQVLMSCVSAWCYGELKNEKDIEVMTRNVRGRF